MLYKAYEVEDLADLKQSDREIIDLLENNGTHLKLVALKKHQIIDAHMAHNNVCIFVVDGELEIKFTQDDTCGCGTCGCGLPHVEDGQELKYKIKKGQLFLFEKDVMHAVEALKDTYFLFAKI